MGSKLAVRSHDDAMNSSPVTAKSAGNTVEESAKHTKTVACNEDASPIFRIMRVVSLSGHGADHMISEVDCGTVLE